MDCGDWKEQHSCHDFYSSYNWNQDGRRRSRDLAIARGITIQNES